MPGVRKATINGQALATICKFQAYPLPEMDARRVIQPFGTNYNGFYRELGIDGHNGWDLRAATGTRAYAVFDGRCIVAGVDGTGGKIVEIVTEGFAVPGYEGEYRLRVLYYHLLAFDVKVGDRVTAGQLLCRTDNTGKYTTGSHLHFGLKVERNKGNGWLTIDKDNGFNGAIDPEAFWPDRSWNEFPVDTKYGQAEDREKEVEWSSSQEAASFFSLFKRLPKDREFFGAVYGGWSPKELLSSATWLEYPKMR